MVIFCMSHFDHAQFLVVIDPSLSFGLHSRISTRTVLMSRQICVNYRGNKGSIKLPEARGTKNTSFECPLNQRFSL